MSTTAFLGLINLFYTIKNGTIYTFMTRILYRSILKSLTFLCLCDCAFTILLGSLCRAQRDPLYPH